MKNANKKGNDIKIIIFCSEIVYFCMLWLEIWYLIKYFKYHSFQYLLYIIVGNHNKFLINIKKNYKIIKISLWNKIFKI